MGREGADRGGERGAEGDGWTDQENFEASKRIGRNSSSHGRFSDG